MSDLIIAWTGGLLIGFAVVSYLYFNGRIAGISGMVAQVLSPQQFVRSPASWFLAGLLIASVLYGVMVNPEIDIQASPLMLIVSGLLVGFGTRLGSGCTSGHGICGISRLSMRSIVATLTFMALGFVTVYVIYHVLGW